MSKIVNASALISALTDAGISGLDAFIAARTGANAAVDLRHQHKEPRVGGAAAQALVVGSMTSLWQNEGFPSHGTAPGAWANPDNTTAGALRQADPGGGRSKWLTYGCAASAASGMLIVYDRLGHCSGLSGALNTTQNTNGGSAGGITRYTGGANNQLWIEINTAIGATPTSVTAAYANQSGAAQTSLAIDIGNTTHNEAGRILPLSLASGDKGVQSVTSITLAASTGTAGDLGVVIAHPLFVIPLAVGNAFAVSFEDGPIPKILSGACLSLAFLASSAPATPTFDVSFEMAEA